MTTWAEANRLANLAAAQAHGDLGIDTTTAPVDVYRAIGDAEVVLMWRPMPRQFGAYFNEPGSRPGILINNGLPHTAQRHTAGHELGHHWLGHGTRTDADLDPPDDRRPAWTPEEKLAEAFAAWFLMPRKVTQAALSLLGIQRPQAPEDAYKLSLLLGTPYRATVRHLPSLRLASQSQAAVWAKTPPSVIKERLDLAGGAPSRKPDVWVISRRFAGAQLTVHPGDRIVVTGPSPALHLVTHPEELTVLPVRPTTLQRQLMPGLEPDPVRHAMVLEVKEKQADSGPVQVTIASPAQTPSDTGQWEFRIQVEGQRSGIASRWVG